MSEERVTRSGRSYPPSPSKSIERRSSTDSSSSERVTRSGKRLRTSDSEDEIPGSPRKSNPPSPTKKMKIEFSDPARSNKRFRSEQEDQSGSSQELSPIKENNHDGDRKVVTSAEEGDFVADDSDPEVSFKESSFRGEEDAMEEEQADNHGNNEDETTVSMVAKDDEDNKQVTSEQGDEKSVHEQGNELVGSEQDTEEETLDQGNKQDTDDTSEKTENVEKAENDMTEPQEQREQSVVDEKDAKGETSVDDVTPKESGDPDSIENTEEIKDSKDKTVVEDGSEKSETERTVESDTDVKSDTKDSTNVIESVDIEDETTDKSNTEISEDQKEETTEAKSKEEEDDKDDDVDDDKDKDKSDDVEKMEVDQPQNVTVKDSEDVVTKDSEDVVTKDSEDVVTKDSEDVVTKESQDVVTKESQDVVTKESQDVVTKESQDVVMKESQDVVVTKADSESGDKDKDVPSDKSDEISKKDADNAEEEERLQKLKEERANLSSPDDVIVLSDDSSGPMVNGMDVDSDCSSPTFQNGLKKLTQDEVTERDKLIRRLQEELRNEEAKLLLLKKLRQSQLQPVQVKDQNAAQGGVPGKLPIPRNPNAQPPPLVRGGQQMLKSQQQVMMPPLVRGNQIQSIRTQASQQGPPPLMLGPRSGVHIQSQMVRPPIVRVGSGSNLVAYSTTPTTYTVQQVVQSQPQQVKVAMPSNTVSAMAAESPASRQAAAKLALRKQLEKTLLQIPPPKPPPPEMHFLPSAANNEFIYLVGLEEVVNRITEELSREKKDKMARFIEPFSCSQCKSDFTTVWKRDPKKANAVMCETCVVTNQKKALKAEHTNRLKTAFVKALQQEQEIEQRMSQSVSTAVTANGTQAHTSHHREQLQKVQQEQLRQHHQLLQAHQQQMQRHHVRPVYGQIPQAHITPTITYAYHVPQLMTKPQVITTLAQPSDRQREYLLDMIPSRSMAQTVTWKQ
ncbi:uncharacterized protein LOC144443366 [Glandiceps talaboti]